MTGLKLTNLRKKKVQHIHDVIPIEYQAEERGWQAGTYDFRNGLIPGADYFNPTLVERKDGRWLIVRSSVRTPKIKVGLNSLIAFTLRDNMPMTGWPLTIPKVHDAEHVEDARTCQIGDKTFLTCCHFWMPSETTWSGARILLVEASNPNSKNAFASAYRRIAVNYAGNGNSHSNRTVPQKNWTPFSFDGKLHILYSASPHVIIEVEPATGKVLKEHKSETDLSIWRHGVIRGGTPPVLHDGLYWTFFHSSLPWRDKLRQYHAGCYAFEPVPPFKIVKITTEPLLSGSRFDLWFPSKPLVVFPGGACMENNGDWTVAYGVNDLTCGHVRIPHPSLLNLMQPV